MFVEGRGDFIQGQNRFLWIIITPNFLFAKIKFASRNFTAFWNAVTSFRLNDIISTNHHSRSWIASKTLALFLWIRSNWHQCKSGVRAGASAGNWWSTHAPCRSRHRTHSPLIPPLPPPLHPSQPRESLRQIPLHASPTPTSDLCPPPPWMHPLRCCTN